MLSVHSNMVGHSNLECILKLCRKICRRPRRTVRITLVEHEGYI